MNERIRELAEQCYQIEDPHGRFPKEVFNQEKFAKLIVRECAAIAEARPIWVVVGKMIKEHFGVEE